MLNYPIVAAQITKYTENLKKDDKFSVKMTNITQRVWDILSNDISIRKNIQRSLINTRALAKYIITNHGVKASLDSVISAIRRFESDEKFSKEYRSIEEALKGSEVSTKTNIACLTFTDFSRNNGPIQKILEKSDLIGNQSLRIVKGEKTVKIILNDTELEKLKDIIKNIESLTIEKDLAEIIIILSEKAQQTKGLFARLTNEISNNEINIHEVITCLPELLIFVKQKDLVKTMDCLYGLIEK